MNTVDRILGSKGTSAADLAPVIQGLLAQVEEASKAKQQAEQRAQAAHEARMKAESERGVALRAQAEAEGGAIREKATREAAEAKAIEAVSRASHHEQMHRAECEKHEATKQALEAARKESGDLKTQLAIAQAEARAARDEIGRVPKPVVSRPPAYEVAWVDREGKPRTMTVTPRS